MARPKRIDMKLVMQAHQVARQTESLDEYKQALAISLPADLDVTLEQTGQTLGVSRATVHRLQTRFKNRRGDGAVPHKSSWGGRRRALLSIEEERDFIKPWAEQAKTGGVLVVSPIRAALSQRLGRPVAASVVYRFLARHGWRKMAPDTRHPKSDPQLQEDWKKNFPKRWRPF
jgi:transposase